MSDFGYGWMSPNDVSSKYNSQVFVINQLLSKVRTLQLGLVLAVNGGGLNVPPTVNVQPLVNMVDGNGNSVPHGTIFNVQVLRWQGGDTALIIDPAVNDIGLLAICDRDISSVINNKGPANPGSNRRFDFADAIYLGSVLGSSPKQYIQSSVQGLTLADRNGNTIAMTKQGITFTDALGNTFTVANYVLHTHGGVTPGGGESGPPTPGT